MLAAKLGVKNLIYCDSSSVWIDSVSKIVSAYSEINAYPVFIDVGDVVEWGRPKDKSHAIAWKNYCYQPWLTAQKNNINPQLVLVDGRFRVACFLNSLLFGSFETTILFDDYYDRDYYKVVENIIEPEGTHDRMATFVIPAQFNRNAALLMLLEYVNNAN